MSLVLRKHRWRVTAGVAVWAAVVAAGVRAMDRHAGQAGPPAKAGPVWPAGVSLPRASGGDTLVLTLHPECPCSRATVDELAILMTRCRGRLNAIVLFVQPTGLTGDPAASELWQSATAIPGVTCRTDRAGKLADRFGAGVSGQVFLYDKTGALQFNGGITESRGHAGDNDGSDAIEAIVHNNIPRTRQTPVFGCTLK